MTVKRASVNLLVRIARAICMSDEIRGYTLNHAHAAISSGTHLLAHMREVELGESTQTGSFRRRARALPTFAY